MINSHNIPQRVGRIRKVLDDLLPVGDFAGGQESVLAGVPAQKVRRVGVFGMSFAAGPDFVEQEGCWAFGGAMQVVNQAAVFFAREANQGAKFGFEEHFLAVAWAQLHDERYRFSRELGVCGRPGFARA